MEFWRPLLFRLFRRERSDDFQSLKRTTDYTDSTDKAQAWRSGVSCSPASRGRNTRFHSNRAFLKLSSRARSNAVIFRYPSIWATCRWNRPPLWDRRSQHHQQSDQEWGCQLIRCDRSRRRCSSGWSTPGPRTTPVRPNCWSIPSCAPIRATRASSPSRKRSGWCRKPLRSHERQECVWGAHAPSRAGFGALAKRTLAPSAQKVHAGEGAGISTRGACAPQNNLAFPLRSRSCDTR